MADSSGIEKIKRWNRAHAFALGISSFGVIYLRSPVLLSFIGLASFSWFLFSNKIISNSSGRSSHYANWVTSMRLSIILVTGFSYPGLNKITIAAVAFAVIAMDALDGYLARKFNSSSIEGAYFDMETDAFFVCLISSLIYLKGLAGAWILPVGYMRYIFVILLFLAGLSGRKERPSGFSRVIAGILFFSLITPFVLGKSVYMPCLIFSSLLLIISFSYSFMNLIYAEE